MKKCIWLMITGIWLFGSGCEPDRKALCDCVTTDTGEWDMYLSEDCQQKMIDVFGPELKGMDEWFRDNCERTAHPRFRNEEKQPIAI